ncbi:MAG: TetR/AcrR family transcriptional regulator [Solirubrobacterales bacterium]
MASSTGTRSEQPSTRERILDHSVQIASAEGLESLTIGRLAADLGMSKSGLFGHFGSKEELQLATIEAGSEIFGRTVIRPARDEAEGAERLSRLVHNFVDYLEGATFEGGCFWGSVSAEFDNRPGPVRDMIKEKLSVWLDVLREQATAAGADDPEQLTFELYSICQGANLQYQLFGDAELFSRARAALDRLLPA